MDLRRLIYKKIVFFLAGKLVTIAVSTNNCLLNVEDTIDATNKMIVIQDIRNVFIPHPAVLYRRWRETSSERST